MSNVNQFEIDDDTLNSMFKKVYWNQLRSWHTTWEVKWIAIRSLWISRTIFKPVNDNVPFNMACGIRCTGTHTDKRVYAGKLFKPWTWFKWQNIKVVTNIRLQSADIVNEPVDPVCVIAERSRNEELYQRMRG